MRLISDWKHNLNNNSKNQHKNGIESNDEINSTTLFFTMNFGRNNNTKYFEFNMMNK